MPSITNPLLDVLVGLALSFFVLSLAPSAMAELLATFTRIRSKFLWAYLNQLFTKATDATPAAAAAAGTQATLPSNAGDAVAASRALVVNNEPEAPAPGTPAPAAVVPDQGVSFTGARPLPSSFRQFALLSKSARGEDPRPKSQGAGIQAVEMIHRQLRPIGMGSALKGTKVDKRTTIKHVPIPSLVQALMEMLLSGTDSGVAAVRIQTGIDQWKGTPIHPTLNAMWLSANNDVLAFRESVSGWFDAEMDRLSGLYKRLLRWVLVSFSVIVALVVNLNPLALAGDLWHDAALRTQFVNAAESTVDNTPTTKDSYQELVAACKKETGTPETPDDIAKAVVKAENCATGALDQAKDLGLTTHAIWSGHWADGWSVRDGVSKVLGLIILTGALAMGAPFWFDILKRLMGIRGALHRRET